MSISTISTINKYLLNFKKLAIANTPLATDVTFPENFNGVQALFDTVENKTYNDCRYTFPVSGDSDSWKNSNDYELLVSSYRYDTLKYTVATQIYSSFDFTTTEWNMWTVNALFSDTRSLPYNLDGVSQGNYTQFEVYTAGGGVYRGGGVGYFWTTVYDGNQSVSGEWFQQKFPFKIKLNSISIMAPPYGAFEKNSPKDVRVLGSDDGMTWFFITDLVFTPYTRRVWQTQSIVTNSIYSYVRCVVPTVILEKQGIHIQQLKYNFDAWDITMPTLPQTSQPTISVLLGSNQSFPSDFNGVTAEFNTTASQQHADCRKIFSVVGDATAYKNSTNGYYLLASSYYQNPTSGFYQSVPNLYSTANATWNKTWSSQAPVTATTLDNYLDGVVQPIYNNKNVYSVNGTTYVGGGSPNVFHTVAYNNGSSTVSGEWFEQKFPFKVQMKSLSVKGDLQYLEVQQPAKVIILGSNDGNNWNFITTLAFGIYTTNIFQTQAIVTDTKYSHIRFVITQIRISKPVFISEVKMTFDAWS
jgi:hypothetical protein